jgi:hypothetical protein
MTLQRNLQTPNFVEELDFFFFWINSALYLPLKTVSAGSLALMFTWVQPMEDRAGMGCSVFSASKAVPPLDLEADFAFH